MTAGPTPEPSDAHALRAATWRLAGVTAAAVSLALLVVGALVLVVVLREQGGQADSALRQAVTEADDVRDQPAPVRVWVRHPDGTTRSSPGAPAWLPVRRLVAAAGPAGHQADSTVQRAGESYRVRTVRRADGLVVQATYDLRTAAEERERLVTAVLVSEVVGLLLSLLLGLLLARRAIAPLAAALERQRRFVADASHELRTPLTLLSTRAQLLERSLRLRGASDVHAQSTSLVADTRRMAGVVDDLLLSASLAAHPHRREPVDLRAVADLAVAAAADHAHQLGVVLVGPGEPEPGTGQQGRPTTVLGAPGPLRRVVDSLLDNAMTHTPEGGTVRVDVTGGARVVVRVSDDGPGIDPAVAPRLFHRFSHTSASAGGRASFGLGLSLVREIVEAHGGHVSGQTDPAGGATFTLTMTARASS